MGRWLRPDAPWPQSSCSCAQPAAWQRLTPAPIPSLYVKEVHPEWQCCVNGMNGVVDNFDVLVRTQLCIAGQCVPGDKKHDVHALLCCAWFAATLPLHVTQSVICVQSLGS